MHFELISFKILIIVVCHFGVCSMPAKDLQVSSSSATSSTVFRSGKHIEYNRHENTDQNRSFRILSDGHLSYPYQDNGANLRQRFLPPPRSRRQRKADVALGQSLGFLEQTLNESPVLLPRHMPFRQNHSRSHNIEGIRSYGRGSTWLEDSLRGRNTDATTTLEQFVIKDRLNPSRCDLIRRSSRHSVECNATGRGVPFPLLVTGVGRSGTSFLQVRFSSQVELHGATFF